MRRLFYASGSVVTTDAICKAVLRYARALAFDRTSEVVSIPVVGEGGTFVHAHLVLGPASQLLSVPVAQEVDDFDASELVAELEHATGRLLPSTPSWPDEMDDTADFDLPARE